jgi:L-asparaginase/beta-aspartyl-peptidase (threonine type)
MRPLILTHGGASGAPELADGCTAAAEAARAVLDRGGDALAAALAATVVLEDDPRFNAGTGSNYRLDGVSIEMDAAVMTSDARFGAVACIEAVKNPILVAARVMETPHLLLTGAGATAFARAHGFPEHDPGTDRARDKHRRALAELTGHGDGTYAELARTWRGHALRKHWNFRQPLPDDLRDCDTVGAVVRDGHGRFAATASTGGTVYMLRGRVGDSPILGAGVYAGPAGAVAATGAGEEIVRRFLAKTVYDWLVEGVAPARAAQRGLALFPEVVDVGLLVAGRDGQAIATNRNMPSAQIVG